MRWGFHFINILFLDVNDIIKEEVYFIDRSIFFKRSFSPQFPAKERFRVSDILQPLRAHIP